MIALQLLITAVSFRLGRPSYGYIQHYAIPAT